VYLEEAALYRTEHMNLGTTHEAQRVTVAETSATFFKLLGEDPEIGRPFLADEDTPGRDHVAVIGYGLWQQFFGGVPGTLGSTIHINGVPLTGIGIAPPGLDYPDKSTIWTPTIFDMEGLSRERALIWTAIGRLNPGVTFAQAAGMYQAEMAAVHKGSLEPAERQRFQVISLRDQLAGDVRKSSLVLLGIVLFVLLTACANVAHLLLSRITERRPEMVLRAALGASRSRLLQQLITESTVLTLCAAAAGLVVAQWASRLAASVQPARLAMQDYSVLDWPVLGFAIGVALLTGFVFGVLPANLISRMQPGVNPLRTQSGGHDRGVRRMRAVLIAMQTTFTLVLLAGSLSMGRSFLRLAGTDLGLRSDHVVTLSVSLSGTSHEPHPQTYYRAALERLRAVPGVESAGAVEYLPLTPPIAFAGFRFKLDNQGGEHLGVIVTATPDSCEP
jgi:putative ABC transport system permease protein